MIYQKKTSTFEDINVAEIKIRAFLPTVFGIRGVLSSQLGRVTGYDEVLLGFPGPSRQILGSCLDYVATVSFQKLSNSLSISRPIIQRYDLQIVTVSWTDPYTS
jgi:hypothetical protein